MSRTRLARGSTLLALMRVRGNSPEKGAMRHLGLALWAGSILCSPLTGAIIYNATTSIVPTGNCTASAGAIGSAQPVSASGQCSFFATIGGQVITTGNNRGFAAASGGHVGVTTEANATNPFGDSGVFANASENGFVTFTGTGGQTGSITVTPNISFTGIVNAAGDRGANAQLAFLVNLNGVGYGISNLSMFGDGDRTCLAIGSFNCDSTFAPGFLPTDPVVVPLNVPVFFSLQISANAGAILITSTNNSAIADFSNSLDLPIGSAIFNLPNGFTANSTDFNIVDNRLASTGVPEPSTFYLGCLSILAFVTVRLIRSTTGRHRPRKTFSPTRHPFLATD